MARERREERRLARAAQAPEPPAAEQVAREEPADDCHPSYSGCLDPNASDYDCAGGSGDGPEYVQGPIEVKGDDPYDLERDDDGIACDV
jgi:hypothetical protein